MTAGKLACVLHDSSRWSRRAARLLAGVLAPLVLAGCTASGYYNTAEVRVATADDAVFYFDGAGGGGLIGWQDKVKDGLRAAGFRGKFQNVRWQTGLGILADHETSHEYKRKQARDAVAKILAFRQRSQGRIHLIGLSAGTAVAVYTLEALPEDVRVDNVALLSSSLTSLYDLTPALRHVSGKMLVTISSEDGVLKASEPVLGTTGDRPGEPAGLVGFVEHDVAGDKIQFLRWRPAYEQQDWDGGHTDVTNAPFVRDVLAPRILE